jgi:hypothetical protein
LKVFNVSVKNNHCHSKLTSEFELTCLSQGHNKSDA